jgi:hypothetical protein
MNSAVQEMLVKYGYEEPEAIVNVKEVIIPAPEVVPVKEVAVPLAVIELIDHYERKIKKPPMAIIPISPNSVPLETPITHKEIATTFPKTFNRLALIRERHRLMKTAIGAPLQGPWYMLYLKPKWVLKALPSKGNYVDHVDYWKVLVDTELVPHYKIKNTGVIRDLYELPYSQPRGRVQDTSKLGKRHWAVYYGVDFQYSQTQRNTILSAFNLTAQFHAGLVTFETDSHEIMIQEDLDMFQDLVGRMDIKEVAKLRIQDVNDEDFDAE